MTPRAGRAGTRRSCSRPHRPRDRSGRTTRTAVDVPSYVRCRRCWPRRSMVSRMLVPVSTRNRGLSGRAGAQDGRVVAGDDVVAAAAVEVVAVGAVGAGRCRRCAGRRCHRCASAVVAVDRRRRAESRRRRCSRRRHRMSAQAQRTAAPVLPPIEVVVAGAAGDPVGAGAADEDVVTGVAGDEVVAPVRGRPRVDRRPREGVVVERDVERQQGRRRSGSPPFRRW